MADKNKDKEEKFKNRPKPSPTNQSRNSITIQYYDGTKWNEVPSNSINNANKVRITDTSPSQQVVSISNSDKDIQTFQQIYNGSDSQIQIEVSNDQKSIKVGPNENSLNQVGQVFNQKFISIDWGTSGNRTVDIVNGNENGNKNTLINGNLEHLFISYDSNTPSEVTGNVGPDGVLELFPSAGNPKHPPLYLDLTKGDPSSKDGPFCINYGGDIVASNIVQGSNGATCVETKGHVVTYASGAPDGMSMRAHWYYDCKAFDENSKMKCWSDKPTPEFLNTEKAFYNFEMTAIIEVGDELGKDIHQSCAFKTRSIPDKPDDTRRSTFEFCFPNSQKPHCYVNYNYAHATYAAASGVKEYTTEGKITPNTPIGLKVVSVIADDRKSTWYGGYINTNPFTADGKINNNGWKLKAEYTATGIEDYHNIPPIWAGCTDYLRVDGYKKCRIYNFSIREIDKTSVKSHTSSN